MVSVLVVVAFSKHSPAFHCPKVRAVSHRSTLVPMALESVTVLSPEPVGELPRAAERMLSTLCLCFLQKLSKDVQNALAKANNTAEETISAMKTVRSFANEEAEANVYWQKLQQVYRLNKREALAYTYYVWSSGVGGLHQR